MKKILKLVTVILVLYAGIFTLTGCNDKRYNGTSKSKNDGKGDIYLLLGTEGLGQVSYYIDESRKIDFDDDFPHQQAYIRLDDETKATINAKADSNWKFVKWIKDNKDYSTDAKLEITINGATELTAVFAEV